MSPMRDGRTNKQTTSKDRATQLLICEPLSFAIFNMCAVQIKFEKVSSYDHMRRTYAKAARLRTTIVTLFPTFRLLDCTASVQN